MHLSFSSHNEYNKLSIIRRYSNVAESPDLRYSAIGTDVVLGYISRNSTLALLVMTAIEPHRVYTKLTASFSITL